MSQSDIRTWHPCMQQKDLDSFPPFVVNKAHGPYIELEGGRKLIDAISSWWCKSLGHQHPKLKAALYRQLEQFEHVILANSTNAVIQQLSEKLASFIPGIEKIFYASDGSSAVEVAMKMSVHARQVRGEKRKHFIALENGYHGETVGALSVSDLGLYRKPYESMLMAVTFIKNIPYILNRTDPLWEDASAFWPHIERQLEPYANSATAIVVEPILQGAGGMKIYSKDFLFRLWQWAKTHDVHFIVDEILTGLYRIGPKLGCDYANIVPDFVCLSKGLTSGWLPLSAVLLSKKVTDLFYEDYEKGANFLHSHTYSGNPLAASVALATLETMESEKIEANVAYLEPYLYALMNQVSQKTKKLKNVRGIGTMVAADIVSPDNQQVGFEISQKAISFGALLRPIGNTIYWMPPLNVTRDVMDALFDITCKAIESV